MEHIHGLATLLVWPFVACVSMGLLHGYAGLHVLRRGVIFVDLALAQMAALGGVVGLFFAAQHGHVHAAAAPAALVSAAPAPDAAGPGDELEQAIRQSDPAAAAREPAADEPREQGLFDLWPTAFALGGAVLLAFSRLGSNRVPHEAIIGVIYVVAAATTVLLLSKSPHGHEQMEEMLTGKLLFIDRAEVLTTGALYAVLGLLHLVFFRPFLAISTSAEAAERAGMRVRLWDTLFYAMFAVMVTRSVAVAGVLVVFSFLIIPGACAAMFVDSFKGRILIAWVVASVVSVLGMAISALGDLPSGSTVVATFGGALVVSAPLGRLVRRWRGPGAALADTSDRGATQCTEIKNCG
jgi:zinc/manganese transport system permease protein